MTHPNGVSAEQHQDTIADDDGVLDRVRESGIEQIYYQFVTLSGRVMAKVVPARHVTRNLEKGVQFHGSAITDLVSDRHGNLIASGPDAEEFLALPDTATFRVLPWAPSVGRFTCNLYRRRDSAVDPGAPLPTCVRGTLQRAHTRGSRARPAWSCARVASPVTCLNCLRGVFVLVVDR